MIWQFVARPAMTMDWMAFLFGTGRAPGMPRHKGQHRVLGGAEAVTNTVVDLAGYTHIKLAALGLEDTATADATNIVVIVTLKKNYW